MRLQTTAFLIALLLFAQNGVAQRATYDPTRLLERCMSIPDELACRATLRQQLTPRQRSIALTYLADAGAEPRDSLLRAAVRADSTNALALYALGSALRFNSSEALPLFTRALALRPDWTLVHRTVAELYGVPGQAPAPDVIRLWQRVIDVEPDAADAHRNVGSGLMAARRSAEAEAAYRKALTLQADLPGAIHGLCLSLLDQAKVTEAQQPCTRAMRGPDRERPPWDLRQILSAAEQAKDYPLALAAAEQGIADDPTSGFYRSDRTRILQHMGREEDAATLLRAYITAHPQDWDAIREIADYMYWRGKLDEARELYLRVVNSKCKRLGCMETGNLAVALLRLGSRDDAFRFLREALEYQSDCPYVIVNFRAALASQSDSSALLTTYRQTLNQIGAAVVAKGDPAPAAEFFVSIQDWENAARFYRAALDKEVEDRRRSIPTGRSGLQWSYGRALVESGRYCEGLRELAEANRTDPVFVSGRPHLQAALDRARQQCTETSK